MEKTRLKEIKARCGAATPGPWTRKGCEWECDCGLHFDSPCELDPATCGNGILISGAWVNEVLTLDNGDYDCMNDADAEFIAASITDIPFLLEHIERLEAEAAELLHLVKEFAWGRCRPYCEHISTAKCLTCTHLADGDDDNWALDMNWVFQPQPPADKGA